MKNRKLLLIVSLVLAMTMSLGGTLAYLTDTDADVNTMVVGNVKIEQHEYERVVDENGDFVTVDTSDVDPNYGYVQAYKLQEFTQNKPAMPVVFVKDGEARNDQSWDEFQQLWNQVGAPGSNDLFADEMKNVIDKFVFVENTGKSDAYYRTLIAIEHPAELAEGIIHTSFNGNSRFDAITSDGKYDGTADSGKKSYFVDYITIDGTRYALYNMTYNEVLIPGEVSRPSLLQIFLDQKADNEDVALFGDTWDVLVVSQAVQTAGFEDAQIALNAAFGEVSGTSHPWIDWDNPDDENDQEPDWYDAVVTNNEELIAALEAGNTKIKLEAGNYTFPAGKYFEGDETLFAENGAVITGNSKLNINGATVIGATFSNPSGTAVDQTINGTFKNCTFTGNNGLRWCYAGETVVFEDCVFSGSTYGIHFDGGANEVLMKNCTISGFNAMGSAITKLTLDGCTFVANGKSSYNGINLWGSTDLIDCTFVFDGTAEYEWVEACAGGGATYNITNCVVSNGLTEKALDSTVFTTRSEANIINFN